MNPKNKIYTSKVLTFYWEKAKKYRSLVILSLITVPIAQLFTNILSPLILANVLEKLSQGSYQTSDIWSVFGTDIILYILVTFSSGIIFWRLADMIVWNLEAKVNRDIAQHVYTHLINRSADFHANNFGGSLVSNNNKLMSGYVRIADTTFYGVVPLIFTVIATSVILAGRAPQFAIGLVAFSIFYVIIAYKVSTPVRIAGSKHAIQESRQTGYLADSVTNVMAIKSFAKGKQESRDYADVTETTKASHMNILKKHQIQMLYFSGLNNTINAGSLLAAIVSVISFNANIATAFLIFNYTSNIVSQLFSFSDKALRSYNRAVGDASEMVRILSEEPEIKDATKPNKSNISRGEVRFRNVNFKHKGASNYLFKELNLRIKPGEKIGLVGRSGSGKTTLTKILLRFSDISKGRIEIDHQDISKISQDSLRQSMAYVPQEPLLFHRSLAENIGYSNENASREEIIAIAKKANAHEFIDTLPDKYETLVGERGVKLSGGQRQRVAIARAMLKNAPILLLDEATSALDSESEELIQDALWKLMEGRTAIVIAHRLSTIQKMDRILVMDNGQIIEEGTHKELIRQGKEYAKLWEKQSGGFIEE